MQKGSQLNRRNLLDWAFDCRQYYTGVGNGAILVSAMVGVVGNGSIVVSQLTDCRGCLLVLLAGRWCWQWYRSSYQCIN
jgi:hypothetical protein